MFSGHCLESVRERNWERGVWTTEREIACVVWHQEGHRIEVAYVDGATDHYSGPRWSPPSWLGTAHCDLFSPLMRPDGGSGTPPHAKTIRLTPLRRHQDRFDLAFPSFLVDRRLPPPKRPLENG
jgi:hypothetical protein